MHSSLQLMITERCDRRCSGCSAKEHLGKRDMSVERAFDLIHFTDKESITILGGEPTLHPDCAQIVRLAAMQTQEGTTRVYTNGANLDAIPQGIADVRVGIHSWRSGPKAMIDLDVERIAARDDVTIVVMLDKKNVTRLPRIAKAAEEEFKVSQLYLSSIKRMDKVSFWEPYEDTLTNEEYATAVTDFVSSYSGGLKIEAASRGVLKEEWWWPGHYTSYCRFETRFVDPLKPPVTCPFAIGGGADRSPGEPCPHSRDGKCVLTKVSFKRRRSR